MNNKSFQASVDAIETQKYKYTFEIANAFKSITAENKLSSKQSEILEAEFILFRFMTHYELSDRSESRFRPFIKYANGDSFPKKSLVTQERLDYYLKRAAETKNPAMKARYLDINFEYNTNIDKAEIIPELLTAYIKASQTEGLGNEMSQIDSIVRAFLLGLLYKDEHSHEYEAAKKNLILSIRSLAEENLRWCLELLEVVVEYKNEFTSDQLIFCYRTAKKGESHYRKIGSSLVILENYVSLKHKLAKIVDIDSYDPLTVAREDAELYLNEADMRKDSPLIQQMHLLKAEKILRNAGLNQEANVLHKRVEAIGKTPEFNETFNSFSFEHEIPSEELEKLRVEVVRHDDKLALIAFSRNFFPSWGDAKKEASAEQYASISDMINTITYNSDGMPIAKASTNRKLRGAIRYYDTSMNICSMLLFVTLRKIINDGDLTLDELDVQLKKLKKLNGATYESVRLGFEHLFAGRYFEALAILVPQLEDMLADVVGVFGMSRYRQSDEDIVEYKTLVPILNDLKKILGNDIYHFLHYQLVDPSRENLRNIIGHGKLKLSTPGLDIKSIIVLQIYLIVLESIKPVGEDSI